MTLIKKIRDYVQDRTLAAGLAGILASVPIPVRADFFDGMPGPKEVQMHYAVHFDDKISHTLALKYFGDDLMAVIAGDSNAEGVQGGFAGAGYIAEVGGVYFLPVVGYSGNEQQGAAHIIVQGTLPLGDGMFMVDSNYHLMMPAHGSDDHNPIHQIGLTPSMGNAEFRIGPECSYEIGKNPSCRLLLRYDPDSEEHRAWVEIGASPDRGVELQLRGNFDL